MNWLMWSPPFAALTVILSWGVVAFVGWQWTKALVRRARYASRPRDFWRDWVRVHPPFATSLARREAVLFLFALEGMELWIRDAPASPWWRVVIRVLLASACLTSWRSWQEEPPPAAAKVDGDVGAPKGVTR